jgi:heme O synthase-like polyprenyltransferase
MTEPSTSGASDERRDRRLRIVAVVLGAFVLLYSVVVAQQILAAVALLVWVFVVYLAWRFVRAHERIAAAAETMATAGRRGPAEATETGTAAGTPPVDDEATDSAEE